MRREGNEALGRAVRATERGWSHEALVEPGHVPVRDVAVAPRPSREEELLARLEVLERRVAELEQPMQAAPVDVITLTPAQPCDDEVRRELDRMIEAHRKHREEMVRTAMLEVPPSVVTAQSLANAVTLKAGETPQIDWSLGDEEFRFDPGRYRMRRS